MTSEVAPTTSGRRGAPAPDRQGTATTDEQGGRAASSQGAAAPGRRDPLGPFEFEPHHCFACGDLNEHGLHLQLHTSPEGSWIDTTLDPTFQGWDAVAHGGIVCTILDEVMAWSVIGRGTWGVTARLNVAFRRPIPTGRPIRAEGWVLEQHRRASRTAGRVLDAATGEVLATSEGTFVALPSKDLERLKARYGLRRTGTAGASDVDTPGTEVVGTSPGPARSGIGTDQ